MASKSPYALQKVVGEEYCRLFTQLYGLETVSTRYFNVFGPRQQADSPYSGVISLFIKALHTGTTPLILGDGEQTRDFVFVDDAVDALVRAFGRGGGLVVNVGTGTATSIADLWETMGGAASPAPRTSSARPNDLARMALSPTRARIQLGWSPFTVLRDGLARLR